MMPCFEVGRNHFRRHRIQSVSMAAYREHITVSGTLGGAYGFAAVFMFGFSLSQAIIAAILGWIAGMLPDLDSQTGRPVRELSAITGAVAPFMLLQHTNALGISGDRAMLFALLLYGFVRYGGASVLGRLTVHRGMFHSVPALLIAAEVTFLTYSSNDQRVRALMAGAVALGFLSHLVLDEVYSVQWDGTRIKLKKSSGSALKFLGKNPLPNGIAIGLLLFLTHATVTSSGILPDPSQEAAPEMLDMTADLDDAPVFLMADEPTGIILR